jgi:hypothetical protein
VGLARAGSLAERERSDGEWGIDSEGLDLEEAD